jgi:RNA polymerase sigma factor (sigma-70 family)
MASGDPAAATAFVRRYQARVYGLASVIVGDGAAEEVAQEAFVRAWRFAGGYDSRRGTVIGWLLAITRNVAIDALRVRTDRPCDPDLLLAEMAEPSGRDLPTDRIVDEEPIRLALKRLPREQAAAVVMAAVFGLTAREIAEREAIPLGTAKTRIRLGLARLRTEWEVTGGRES